MNENTIVESQEVSLESQCKRYLDTLDSAKNLRNQIKEVKQNLPETEKLEKLNEEIKQLKQKVNNDEEIADLKDKLADKKQELELLDVIILEQLAKQQLSLFDVQDYTFKVGKKLKVKKVQKQKTNLRGVSIS